MKIFEFFRKHAAELYVFCGLLFLILGFALASIPYFFLAVYCNLRYDFICLERRMDKVEDENDRVNRQLVDAVKKTLGDGGM